MPYDGPERRESPTWADMNLLGSELRAEMHRGNQELRDEMHEGFDRVDRRIIASAVAITSLLSIAIGIAIAVMR